MTNEYPKYAQFPDHSGGYNYVKRIRVLDENGSLRYVEREDGEREWIDYRDIEGWQC